jgi:alpha-D-glucose phosphate-specific phosphoglucomutase
VIAEDFTFDNVRKCAQATCQYLLRSGLASRGLIVGYDTRFASEDFAAAVAEVAAGNGIKTYLCARATPTPVVSYGTMARKAGGAVIITASHNPGTWNGFKIKSEDGTSAPPEVTSEVEKNLSSLSENGDVKRLSVASAMRQGLVQHVDLSAAYFEQLGNLVDLPALRRSDLKVVVDPMHGAGSGYLKTLLDGGNLVVTQTQDERNPSFPGMERPEPIAQNLKMLGAAVRRRKAAVGVATDGDADRVGAVDEKGSFITTLQMYALLCLYLLEVRRQRGMIVRTITTTAMLDRLGELYSVPVKETPVGFKWVAPIMMKENALIGGEESGGYGFRGHVMERDGILASLYFLDFLAKTGKKPSQLIEYLYSKVGPHHFDRVDVSFPDEERATIASRVSMSRHDEVAGRRVSRYETADGFRFVLDDTSWLLIRFSGTEPLLRIYAEASSPARVRELLETGRGMTGLAANSV